MRRERRRKLTPRELAAITTPGLVTRRIPPPVNIHAPKKEGAKSPSPVRIGTGDPPFAATIKQTFYPHRDGGPPFCGHDQTNVLSRRRREARGVWT